MADEYEYVARGKLTLKTDSSKVSKKKKKKDKKNREKFERELEEQMSKYEQNSSSQPSQRPTMTKAEMAFKKMQDKIVSIRF